MAAGMAAPVGRPPQDTLSSNRHLLTSHSRAYCRCLLIPLREVNMDFRGVRGGECLALITGDSSSVSAEAAVSDVAFLATFGEHCVRSLK